MIFSAILINFVPLTKLNIMDYRQERADKGVKRNKYNSQINPKYKSHLMKCNSNELPNEFTEEEYLQAVRNSCFYCGATNQVTLTRITRGDGYTYENSRPCCYNCHMFKIGKEEREFLLHIDRIVKHQTQHYSEDY